MKVIIYANYLSTPPRLLPEAGAVGVLGLITRGSSAAGADWTGADCCGTTCCMLSGIWLGDDVVAGCSLAAGAAGAGVT